MSQKLCTSFAAAIALSSGLMLSQAADANIAYNATHIINSGDSSDGTRERAYAAGVSKLIVSPDKQNIKDMEEQGFSQEYVPYVLACQAEVNPGNAVKDVKNVTATMIGQFEDCVKRENVLNMATARDTKAAIQEGMGVSQSSYLAECQNSNGIKAGKRDGVTIKQAENTIECVEEKASEKGVYIVFGGLLLIVSGVYVLPRMMLRP